MQAVPANTILKVGLFKMRRRKCPLNMDANEGRIYRVADLSDGEQCKNTTARNQYEFC